MHNKAADAAYIADIAHMYSAAASVKTLMLIRQILKCCETTSQFCVSVVSLFHMRFPGGSLLQNNVNDKLRCTDQQLILTDVLTQSL